MKPCRNSPPPRRAAGNGGAHTEAPPESTGAAVHVNRYCHPIRVKGAVRSGGTEELLSYVLEALSHQADLLDELLRRTEGQQEQAGYKADTT